MRTMRDMEYRKAAAEARLSLSVRKFSDPDFFDSDIINMIMILLDIMPHSRDWDHGCLRSLKAGIIALAKERGILKETKELLATLPKYSVKRRNDSPPAT